MTCPHSEIVKSGLQQCGCGSWFVGKSVTIIASTRYKTPYIGVEIFPSNSLGWVTDNSINIVPLNAKVK